MMTGYNINVLRTFFRSQYARLVAIAVLALLYGFTRAPEVSVAERKAAAQRFHFAKMALPEVPGPTKRSVRPVNPSLRHIAAWVSAVGAGVSLSDLDNDGLPNDLCYVDTRTDQVIVAPVPGTPQRYQPFVLDPTSKLFNRDTMAPMGCLPGDVNEDGLMDTIVYYWGRTPLVFLNKDLPKTNHLSMNADRFAAQEIMPGNERWYTNAATLADLDGDGHMDLIIGNYYQDGARILDAQASEPDVMQHSMSRAYNGGSKHFFRWVTANGGPHPSVLFKEMENVIDGDQKYLNGWTLAVAAADLDRDLLPELYIANDFGPDLLLHNRSKPGEFHFTPLQGTKTFTTASSRVLGKDSFKGMGVDFGDLNGDGLPDILVSNIGEDYALEESNFAFLSTGKIQLMKSGVAPYVDRSELLGLSRAGWAWDVKTGDFDNDGTLEVIMATGFMQGAANRWPELHELAMGNDQLLEHPETWARFQVGDDCLSCLDHNPFFVKMSNNRYFDIASELGLNTSEISRGIATADVDGDGRLDFAVSNQWNTSYFYHNESPNVGSFLGLRLRLPVNGNFSGARDVYSGRGDSDLRTRPAIGAQASAYLPDGRQLVDQVDGGNGHSGRRSQDLEFGLGLLPADTKVGVLLHWRDRNGVIRTQDFQLTPGWHTVLLGGTNESF